MAIEEDALVFLKPDAVLRRQVGSIAIRAILRLNLRLETFDVPSPPPGFLGEKHYAAHKGRFFYNWLLQYTSICRPIVLVLRGPEATRQLRDLLGATLPEKANPGTIRGDYGIAGGINVAHSSDSREAGAQEVAMWSEFLKGPDEDARRSAEYYARRYESFAHTETREYRSVSHALTKGAIGQEEARDSFVALLERETDADKGTVGAFADVAVRNALLR